MDVGLVCDACSAFNPMGSPGCVRCGTRLSLDAPGANAHPPTAPDSDQDDQPERTRPGGPDPAAPATRPCPRCREEVVIGHAFCWSCGARTDAAADGAPRRTVPAAGSAPPTTAAPLAQSGRSAAAPLVAATSGGSTKRTMFFGAMQATRAKLVLIKGDGLDGVSFTLAGEEHVAGRVDCPLLFEEDPFLSPLHANFFYRNNQLVVRDEDSVNGVFIRIRGATDIRFDARFLVGEQVLEVQTALGNDGDRPADDGTYFFASPRRPSNMRVVQALRGGDSGLAYRAPTDVVSVGREGNDINFPDDPFISGHHAQITFEGGRVVLTDLNSKNGTFLRVIDEHVLKHGDYVFMGQQLLRVEIV